MELRIKKTLLFVAKLSVSAISLYIIFSKTDSGQILSILNNINILYFLAAALLYIFSQFIASIRWKLFLPERFRIKKLFLLYMIGAFFSSFLPGIIGGDVVKAYYLNKDSKNISLTLASIFMDRYMGYVSLMTIGILSFPFALHYFSESVYRWILPIMFAVFVIGSILFFGLQLGKRFRVVSKFYEYFSALKTRKDVIIKSFLISFLVHFINFSKVILLSFAIGEDIPLLVFFFFLPIVITITSLPISIAGLGVREGSVVVLLGLIGVKPEAATALALAWFFSTVVGSLPGLIAYIKHADNLQLKGKNVSSVSSETEIPR